jgi:hypothetical protein
MYRSPNRAPYLHHRRAAIRACGIIPPMRRRIASTGSTNMRDARTTRSSIFRLVLIATISIAGACVLFLGYVFWYIQHLGTYGP